jgi:ankyrin repeat protein
MELKMARKINLIIVFFILFLAKALYADDYKWDLVNALGRNDFQKIEDILKENVNIMSSAEKRLVMGFALNYTRGENTLKVLELLLKYNIDVITFDLFDAINKNHSDNVIQFIFGWGKVQPNGEILLLAMEKQRFNFVKPFIEMGADVNYKYPADKIYADGMTPLLYACKWGNFEMVKLLVEHGASMNVSTKDGSTALSIIREKGQTSIENYLKEHGAIETAINPAPIQNATGISGILNNQLIILQNGTYRLSGSNSELIFTGNANMGNILYTNNGKINTGYFRIEGNNMTIIMEGHTFTYKIDSNISFSGNGEVWIRINN